MRGTVWKELLDIDRMQNKTKLYEVGWKVITQSFHSEFYLKNNYETFRNSVIKQDSTHLTYDKLIWM